MKYLTLAMIFLSSHSIAQPPSKVAAGLSSRYKSFFPIGVAVSPRALQTDEAELIRGQFNSITAENAMKMGPIHPTEKSYYWNGADSIVAFAEKNRMKIRGHTLCWHNQTPVWFFKDSAGNEVTREVLIARLREHIFTVVGRYKEKIYAWDVVNEAISDKPDEYLRPSLWLKICGEEYISKAFQFAHEADPDALLFYNDYNETNPVKREKIFRLIKELKEKGVPVHGLGLQAHYNIYSPSKAQLDSALRLYSTLPVTLQITELDISVYPSDTSSWRKSGDTSTLFTPEREQLQLEKYRDFFELFRKYAANISGVTFWNISDRRSWLDNFPVRGRKNYPLLFDKDLAPKKAYAEVINFNDGNKLKGK